MNGHLGAGLCASFVLVMATAGCTDFVLALPIEETNEPVSATFRPEANVRYDVWAQYNIDLSDEDAKGFCYELKVDVLDGDRAVASQTCFAFPLGRCEGQGRRSLGQCRSDCSFESGSSKALTVRATLRQTEKRCLLKPKPTCGRPFDRCLQALLDPKQITSYKVKLAKR